MRNPKIWKELPSEGRERRDLIRCMAWAGTGVLWTLNGGILKAATLGSPAPGGQDGASSSGSTLSFVQLSDSHIGFHQEANPNVLGSLQQAVDKVNALPKRPSFVIHTGDVSHLSKAEQFDTARQALQTIKTDGMFFVPGEHDAIGDNGEEFFNHFGKGSSGKGYYSFDYGGMHCVGLVNVLDFKAGSLSLLGDEQLKWVEKDLKHVSSSTPIVVFAHIPLWTVYEKWGWGTADAPALYSYLRRFGSVTVLNGHIHQIQQKIEGNMTFYTARGTAYPQPQPGAPGLDPGPLTVPSGQLPSYLGLREVRRVNVKGPLAVTDTSLALT